jgi:hypothetical protein
VSSRDVETTFGASIIAAQLVVRPTGWLSVIGQIGAGTPFTRPSYTAIGAANPVFRTPWITGRGELEIALTL